MILDAQHCFKLSVRLCKVPLALCTLAMQDGRSPVASCQAQQAAEAHLEEVLWTGQGRCEQAVHIQAEALQAAAATHQAL